MTELDTRFFDDTMWDLLPELGIGGSSWTVETNTGNTVSTAKTWTSAGTITGYVVESPPSSEQLSLAGGRLLQAGWTFLGKTALAGALISPARITSVSDPTKVFLVRGLDLSEIPNVTVAALDRV